MKVYVVTAGEYSDYHIERVFTDKSMALAYIEGKGNYGNVEIFDVNEEKHSPLASFTVAYIDGNFYAHEERKNCYIDSTLFRPARPSWFGREWTRKYMPKGKQVPMYITDVIADSEEKALKIAQDRWAKFKAEKAGI